MKPRLPTTFAVAALFLFVVGPASSDCAAQAASVHEAAGPTASAQKHLLNLTPAWKVGQKFGYVADASIKLHPTVSKPAAANTYALNNLEITSHIEGEGEVLATKNGALTKMSLTVTAMNATSAGRPVDNKPIGTMQRPTQIFDAGVKVVIERDEAGRQIFTVDGKPLIGFISGSTTSPAMNIRSNGRTTYSAVAYWLRMLIDLDDFQGTDQVVFGPKEAVALGESWPAKDQALTKTFEAFNEFYDYIDTPTSDPLHQPLKFPPTIVTMKFDQVMGSGADQVAVVSGAFDIKRMDLPPQPAATQVPDRVMDLEGKSSLSFPLSAGKGVTKKTSAMLAKIYLATAQSAGAPNDTVNRSIEFKLTQQYTFP
jgi:hypothetical protein